jgi:exonuclease III
MDNNPSTGFKKNGIGVELSYAFGSRNGQFYRSDGSSFSVYHDEIGLITLPTVTSNKFEIGIWRSIYNNTMANKIKFLLVDENSGGDIAGPYTYNFINQEAQIKPFQWSKSSPSDLRVLTYNVLRDNLFEVDLQPNFKRIFQAIKPDIIGLCEIYDYTAAQTKQVIESFLPSNNNQKWYFGDAVPDIRLVSRYPIKESLQIDGNGIFLLDINGKELLYIVTHLPCCDNESARQREVDKLMSFVRDVKFGIASIQVPQNTPIIIAGDMNLVGLREQINTFITGDIANNNSFGIDFKPDWDDSNLEDAKPATTGLPTIITWYNDFGSYSAGRLDYCLYTGSKIKKRNSFALFSESMSNQDLLAGGIFREDILKASDHTPLVVDFSFDLSTNGYTDINDDIHFSILGNNLNVECSALDNKTKVYAQSMDGKRVSLPVIFDNEKSLTVDLSSLEFAGIWMITIQNHNRSWSYKWIKY